jgi:hypothetical protein
MRLAPPRSGPWMARNNMQRDPFRQEDPALPVLLPLTRPL